MKAYNQLLRYTLIALALFPALWGVFSFLNNTSGFDSTLQYAVKPMLSMEDTYNNPAQTWRAIKADWIAFLGLIMITAMETTAGVLGCIAIYKMFMARNESYTKFLVGKMFLIGGCLAAVMVWGIGFMVVAGDWFLSWQSKGGINGQLGAMMYTMPCLVILLIAVVHKE